MEIGEITWLTEGSGLEINVEIAACEAATALLKIYNPRIESQRMPDQSARQLSILGVHFEGIPLATMAANWSN